MGSKGSSTPQIVMLQLVHGRHNSAEQPTNARPASKRFTLRIVFVRFLANLGNGRESGHRGGTVDMIGVLTS